MAGFQSDNVFVVPVQNLTRLLIPTLLHWELSSPSSHNPELSLDYCKSSTKLVFSCMINTSLTIALHTSGPGQSLLSKQQEHSTVTWWGDGGSPSLLAEQPLVHPPCWDTELFRSLQASRSTAAHFQELLIETNPAVQSLGCITKTTPGNKSQSTHLQSRYWRSRHFLEKSHCACEPGETLRGCFALSALPGLKYICNKIQWPWIANRVHVFIQRSLLSSAFSID